MVKGSSIHGVFQLGQMIPHPVQAVIIPLAQQPCGGKCFERAEFIPQRELIGGVVLKAIGKGAGKQRLAGEVRQLRQGAALRIGGGIAGLKTVQRVNAAKNTPNTAMVRMVRGLLFSTAAPP